MAKRKRLTPAQGSYLAPDATSAPLSAAPLGASSAPIAQVASEASAHAALEELSSVLAEARSKGLMIQELPLSAIDGGYLVRDRLEQNPEEMEALEASLRARGQQTPIEVVALPELVDGMTHGLISGWRRLTALTALHDGGRAPQFATVLARVIEPDSAEAAYVAMVEENEIRVNLSHYERARIAVRALKEGVFQSQKLALQGLFGNATRSRRSKIGSFVTLVESLDGLLHFPTAISERLGLALVKEIESSPAFLAALEAEMLKTPRGTPDEELAVLNAALERPRPAAEATSPPDHPVTQGASPVRPRVRSTTPKMAVGERLILNAGPGLRLGFSPDEGKIELMGTAVGEDLLADLQDWLRRREA